MNVKNGIILAKRVLSAAIQDGDHSKIIAYVKLLADMREFYGKYWDIPTDGIYQEMVKLLRTPEAVMLAAALDADKRNLLDAAIHFAEIAVAVSGQSRYGIELVAFLRKKGEVARARAICNAVDKQHADYWYAQSELFNCDVFESFEKRDYYDLFAEIHAKHQPRVYLEIGVATGKSLALARTGTRALGIDPALAAQGSPLYHSPENLPHLYGMTSDGFFATVDVSKEMGQPCFDVAFIDGLHHFDQVLRDFINLERFAGKDSVILIHDCLPINPQVATRERSTAFWTGDVWKIIPCLKAVRPELEIVTLPAAPAGLALVRCLDSTSKVLARQYHAVVEQFDALVLPDAWDERCQLLAVETEEAAFRFESFFPAGGWQ